MRVKGTLVFLFLALALAFPQVAMAVNPVHNFACDKCHLSGLTINSLSGNVCLTCHGGTPKTTTMILRGDATSDAGFVTGDASAQYGHNPAPVNESSHNWAAPSVNPKAGAVEPTDLGFYSRQGATVGKVACSRCHNPHGDLDTNPKLLPLVNPRSTTPMTPNAMCLACHKTFADSLQADHGLLSHPMIPNYAAFQSGNTDKYKAVTDDSSTAPDAYANGIQLVNGDVSCLSCHNLHFTDSDSSTTDGPLGNSGANGPGDGLLLRTDGTQFVTDPDPAKASGLCTTCHNLSPATSMHGSGGANDIGCGGCHDGHNVSVIAGVDPSYFMLAANYTELPTEFGGTANREDLWGGTQLGVVDGFCETCHGDIGDSPFNAVRTHTQGEDCSVCHLSHSEGAFSNPIGCDGCHGSPPQLATAGNSSATNFAGADGYAWAPIGAVAGSPYSYEFSDGDGPTPNAFYKNETQTPHTSHAGASSNYSFQCQVCHNTHIDNFAGTHNQGNASFQDVLEAASAFDPRVVAAGGVNPSYNDGALIGTCSTVYCHSNGGVNDGTGARTYTFNDPNWSDAGPGAKGDFGIGTGSECSRCHGNSSGSMGSAKHDKHLAGFSCNICHANTATSSTDLVGVLTSPPTAHINQTLDIAFDTTSDLKTGGAPVAQGSNPYSDATAMTCSAVYCHSSGQSLPANRNYQTISWTTAGPLSCTSCHNVPSASQTAAHAAHVNGSTSNVGRNLDCVTCHADTVVNSTTLVAGANGPAGKHVNGKVDIKLPASIDPSLDCSTSLCHSDGNLDSGTDHFPTANPKNNSPAWTLADGTPGTFNACDKCHGEDVANKAYPAYNDGDPAGPDANSHNKHVGTSGFSCEECHATTTADGTSVIAGGTHVDQTIDVGSAKITAWDGTTCSAAACHGVDTPTWGGSVLCGSCHATNNTLADSHPAHYNSATPGDYTVGSNDSIATDYQIQCGVCHSTNDPGAITHGGGRAADAPTYNSAEVNFDGTLASGDFARGAAITNDVNGFEYSDATCANLYCHGNFGGNGNNDTIATPTWGIAASGACGTCHDVDTSPAMDGGSHSKHVTVSGIDCDFCHGGTAANAAGGILDKSLHVNQLLNWELNATKSQLTASSTYDGTNAGTRAKADVGTGSYASCDTVYCHSNVQTVPPGGALTYSTPLWGGAAPCGTCHKADAPSVEQDTASHLIHTDADQYGSRFACSACHDSAGSGTDQHANYEVNVNINTTYSRGGASYNGATLAPGDPYGNCLNLTCHSNGQAGDPLVLPSWNTSLDCASCHDEAKSGTTLSGAHEEHIFGATATLGKDLGCEQCHNDTVSNSTTVTSYALHVNFNKDIKVAIDGTTCNNIQCHSDGNFGNLVYNNPNFASDTLGCTSCHGDGVVLGKAYPDYADGNDASVNANSHNAHVGNSSVKCQECHEATSVDGTSLNGTDPTQHVDQGIDVVLKQGGTFTQGTTETCSATYCHGAGASPAWGTLGPLACDTCHSASSALADTHGVHYNSAALATTINANNDSTAAKYLFQCGNCHNATNHAGGAVSAGVQAAEVSFAGSGTYNADSVSAGTDRGFDYTAGTCTTNDCHNDGTAAKGAPNYNGATLQWSVTNLPADCTGCHDNNAAAASTMGTGAHTKHVNNANNGASKLCYNCHNATVDNTDRAITDKTVHANGVLNVAILLSLDGGNSAYAGSCNAVYCHSTGQSTSDGNVATPTYNTATWATPASGACGTCHKVTEASGLTSGSHGEHLGTAGVNGCGDCHTGAADNASSYNSIEHVDQTIDVANTYNAAGLPGNGYGTCKAAICHDDGTGAFAETPVWGTAGGCASCHASDMTSGSHDTHLLSTINQAAFDCGNCHDGAQKDTTAPSTHLNTLVDVYNSAVGDFGGSYTAGKAKGSAYGSCATTYCHGDTLSYSAGDGITTSPEWGQTYGSNANNCDVCHGYPPNGGGAHPTSTSCDSCHFHVNATNDGFDDVTKHIDHIVQVDGGATCTDCHGTGKYKDPNLNHPDHADHTDVDAFLGSKTLATNDYGDPNKGWFDVTYDASGKIVAGCGQCHPDNQATYHLSGSVDIQLDPTAASSTIPTPNAKLGNTGESYTGSQCTAVYCHSNGDGVYDATLPTWGGVAEALTCGDCHGNSPTTAAHGLHEVGIHYEELYDVDGVGLMPASATVASGTVAAHGDPSYSTTINCFTCHNVTVTDSANADNSTCMGCHSDANDITKGDELARIQTGSSFHLNGAKNVSFADLSGFKSKAQLRDNLGDADDGSNILSNIWNRITGYKGATTYDTAQAAFSAPTFTQGADTCSTVACHNGNTATWSDSGVDCLYCHTSLPK